MYVKVIQNIGSLSALSTFPKLSRHSERLSLDPPISVEPQNLNIYCIYYTHKFAYCNMASLSTQKQTMVHVAKLFLTQTLVLYNDLPISLR